MINRGYRDPGGIHNLTLVSTDLASRPLKKCYQACKQCISIRGQDHLCMDACVSFFMGLVWPGATQMNH